MHKRQLRYTLEEQMIIKNPVPAKEDVIANRLSIIFGGPKGGPCGCMGVPPCRNTGKRFLIEE